MDAMMIDRVVRLEKKNERLRLWLSSTSLATLFLLALFVYEFLGFELMRHKELHAESLVIHDSHGNIRAELTAKNNIALLSIFGNDGFPRIAMSVVDDDPGFHLYNHVGIRRAVFGINNGAPNLMFMNTAGFPEYVSLANGNIDAQPITLIQQPTPHQAPMKQSG